MLINADAEENEVEEEAEDDLFCLRYFCCCRASMTRYKKLES